MALATSRVLARLAPGSVQLAAVWLLPAGPGELAGTGGELAAALLDEPLAAQSVLAALEALEQPPTARPTATIRDAPVTLTRRPVF
jgi:hypothetical protein